MDSQSSHPLEETIPIKSVTRKWKPKKLLLRALQRLSILVKKSPKPRKEILPQPPLHLPGLIEEQILSRLPVKSLMRFRCVSKSWRSFIDTKHFVEAHLYTNKTAGRLKTMLHCHQHGLMKQHEPLLEPSPIVDDPRNNHLMSGSVVDQCNGLFCVFTRPCNFFLWNPSIKLSSELPKPDAQNLPITKWGFGRDEHSGVYKVFVGMSDENNQGIGQVYSSKTNSWRRVECGSVGSVGKNGTVAFGKIHWLGISGGDVYIESFDLKSDVFGRIEVPYKPEGGAHMWLRFDGFLRVVCKITNDSSKCRVWGMKEYGVKESWVENISKLEKNSRCCTSIFYTESLVSPLVFNKN